MCLCLRLQVSGTMKEPSRGVLTSARPPGAARTTSKRYIHLRSPPLSRVTAASHNRRHRQLDNHSAVVSVLRLQAPNTHTAKSKSMSLPFLRFIAFTQNVFYLSGPEVGVNSMLLKTGFHSCLSAGLGGRPADHTELLGLQLSRPRSNFNFLLPSGFHSSALSHLIMACCFGETVQELLSKGETYCSLLSGLTQANSSY